MRAHSPNVSERLELAIRRQLDDIQQHPTRPNLRLCGRNHYWVQAEIGAQTGDHTAAAHAATEMTHELNDEWQTWYDGACLLARCVSLVMNDGKLSAAERAKFARSYSSQAVKFLVLAMHKGFREVGRLTRDSDLKPVRSNSAFKSLVSSARAARQVA